MCCPIQPFFSVNNFENVTEIRKDCFEDEYTANIENFSPSISEGLKQLNIDGVVKNESIDYFNEKSKIAFEADDFMKICTFKNDYDLKNNDIFEGKMSCDR